LAEYFLNQWQTPEHQTDKIIKIFFDVMIWLVLAAVLVDQSIR